MGFRHHDTASVYPAGFTRIGSDRYTSSLNNIVFEGRATPLQMWGQGSASSSAVGSWTVRDHEGTVVATGGAIAAGGSWPLPSTCGPGWYRVYFYTAAGVPMGTSCLVVTRDVAGMSTISAAWWGEQALFAKLHLANLRMLINDSANPSADYATIDNQLLIYSQIDPFDVDRPKHKFISFHNGTGSSAGVTAAVAHYPQVDYWEGTNEPNAHPNAFFVPSQQAFYTAVKAGNANAKVLGPCPVTIGGAATSSLSSFFGAGGGNYIDVISFHTYNAHVGDLHLGRRSWDSWVALLTTYGQHNKPRANTEAGGFFAAEAGAGQYMRQASFVMLDVLLNEQYGVQKESWFYFYSQLLGFWDYPSGLTGEYGQPFPAVAMLLTHSQELLGATWETRHDFGTIDNDFVIGSSYRRADSTGVVSVMAPGKRDHPVTYEVTGGAASSLTLIDCWGNQNIALVTDGLVTVTVQPEPAYVRLPAGITMTPVSSGARYGTRRDAGSTVTTSSGSQGTTSIATLVTDTYPNKLFFNASNATRDVDSVWQSTGTPTAGPETVTVALPSAVQVSMVIVHCPPAWQPTSTPITAASVEALVDGTWVTVGDVDETLTVVKSLTTPQDGVSGYYDSFYDEAHIFEVAFFPVVATAIRLVISGVTFGGCPTLEAYNAYGERNDSNAAVTAGFGAVTPRVAIQRISVFDAGYTAPLPTTPTGPVTTSIRVL